MPRRGSNRKMLWSRNASGASTVPQSGGSLGVHLSSTLLPSDRNEATLVRIVAKIAMVSDVSGTQRSVSYGILLEDEDSTTFPNPAVQLDRDWITHGLLTRSETGFVEREYERFDLRAKRRLREADRALWLIFRNDDAVDNTVYFVVNSLFSCR